MAGLKMRFGGDSPQEPKLDFSHLESNPNYKPEDEPSATPTEATIDEPVEQPSSEIADVDPTNEPIEQPTGKPTGQSTEQPSDEPVQPELTNDILFQTLSEQLGREIKSLDDLTSSQEELNPQLKEINDWSKKNGRPIEDFFKFQKDYSQVSDEDIAREFLQEKYPMFNEQEIAYKMQSMVQSEDDLEEDTLRKNMELKMFASEGRNHFNSLKQELNTPANNFMSDEVKQKVQAFDQFQEQISGQQEAQKSYYEGLVNASSMSDKVKLNISEELSLDYNISEGDRKSIPEFINNMPHWKQEDGSWNHEAVVQDAYKIKYFNQIVKLAYEQGISSGTSDTIKQQNNITLDSPSGANSQDNGKKKPIIEDLDKLIGNQGLKFRF